MTAARYRLRPYRQFQEWQKYKSGITSFESVKICTSRIITWLHVETHISLYHGQIEPSSSLAHVPVYCTSVYCSAVRKCTVPCMNFLCSLGTQVQDIYSMTDNGIWMNISIMAEAKIRSLVSLKNMIFTPISYAEPGSQRLKESEFDNVLENHIECEIVSLRYLNHPKWMFSCLWDTWGTTLHDAKLWFMVRVRKAYDIKHKNKLS